MPRVQADANVKVMEILNRPSALKPRVCDIDILPFYV